MSCTDLLFQWVQRGLSKLHTNLRMWIRMWRVNMLESISSLHVEISGTQVVYGIVIELQPNAQL